MKHNKKYTIKERIHFFKTNFKREFPLATKIIEYLMYSLVLGGLAYILAVMFYWYICGINTF